MKVDATEPLTTSITDHSVAHDIATEAGGLLLALREELADEEPHMLRAEGDRRSNDLILGRLGSLRPDDGILSEESADDGRRLVNRRVWIVDPLDGTREYAEAGRVDWAVHVALWEDGVLAAGAVALPGMELTLSTRVPPVLAPNGHGGELRMAVSRTRPTQAVLELSGVLGMTLVPMGSAGAKAMAVVQGEADAYVHAGGQFEWDSAAPVAVATAAGLHASRIDGGPLLYNRPDPSLPDLVICRPEIADRILAAIASMATAFNP